MAVLGLTNLAVKVVDMDAACAFYEAAGAEVRDRMSWKGAERADIYLGPVMITLFTRAIYEDDVPVADEGFLHAALMTDDLDAALAGQDVLWGPATVEGTFGKRRIAFVRAPGNMRLEFMEEIEKPAGPGNSITIQPNQSGRLWSEDPERWRELRTKAGCPWCRGPGPADTDVLAETEMCWVTAQPTATLPGYVCVITKEHVIEPFELPDASRDAFFADAMAVARGVANALQPAKVNYEIHGNTVPHLHMHIYPRFADDPYVGYMITNRVSFTRTRAELDRIGAAVRAELAACGRLVDPRPS